MSCDAAAATLGCRSHQAYADLLERLLRQDLSLQQALNSAARHAMAGKPFSVTCLVRPPASGLAGPCWLPYLQVQSCLLTDEQAGIREASSAPQEPARHPPGIKLTHTLLSLEHQLSMSATVTQAGRASGEGPTAGASALESTADALGLCGLGLSPNDIGSPLHQDLAKGLAAELSPSIITIISQDTGAVLYQNPQSIHYMGFAPPVPTEPQQDQQQQQRPQAASAIRKSGSSRRNGGRGSCDGAGAPQVPRVLRELLQLEPAALQALQACLDAGEDFEQTVQVPPSLQPFVESLRTTPNTPIQAAAMAAVRAAAAANASHHASGASQGCGPPAPGHHPCGCAGSSTPTAAPAVPPRPGGAAATGVVGAPPHLKCSSRVPSLSQLSLSLRTPSRLGRMSLAGSASAAAAAGLRAGPASPSAADADLAEAFGTGAAGSPPCSPTNAPLQPWRASAAGGVQHAQGTGAFSPPHMMVTVPGAADGSTLQPPPLLTLGGSSRHSRPSSPLGDGAGRGPAQLQHASGAQRPTGQRAMPPNKSTSLSNLTRRLSRFLLNKAHTFGPTGVVAGAAPDALAGPEGSRGGAPGGPGMGSVRTSRQSGGGQPPAAAASDTTTADDEDDRLGGLCSMDGRFGFRSSLAGQQLSDAEFIQQQHIGSGISIGVGSVLARGVYDSAPSRLGPFPIAPKSRSSGGTASGFGSGLLLQENAAPQFTAVTHHPHLARSHYGTSPQGTGGFASSFASAMPASGMPLQVRRHARFSHSNAMPGSSSVRRACTSTDMASSGAASFESPSTARAVCGSLNRKSGRLLGSSNGNANRILLVPSAARTPTGRPSLSLAPRSNSIFKAIQELAAAAERPMGQSSALGPGGPRDASLGGRSAPGMAPDSFSQSMDSPRPGTERHGSSLGPASGGNGGNGATAGGGAMPAGMNAVWSSELELFGEFSDLANSPSSAGRRMDSVAALRLCTTVVARNRPLRRSVTLTNVLGSGSSRNLNVASGAGSLAGMAALPALGCAFSTSVNGDMAALVPAAQPAGASPDKPKLRAPGAVEAVNRAPAIAAAAGASTGAACTPLKAALPGGMLPASAPLPITGGSLSAAAAMVAPSGVLRMPTTDSSSRAVSVNCNLLLHDDNSSKFSHGSCLLGSMGDEQAAETLRIGLQALHRDLYGEDEAPAPERSSALSPAAAPGMSASGAAAAAAGADNACAASPFTAEVAAGAALQQRPALAGGADAAAAAAATCKPLPTPAASFSSFSGSSLPLTDANSTRPSSTLAPALHLATLQLWGEGSQQMQQVMLASGTASSGQLQRRPEVSLVLEGTIVEGAADLDSSDDEDLNVLKNASAAVEAAEPPRYEQLQRLPRSTSHDSLVCLAVASAAASLSAAPAAASLAGCSASRTQGQTQQAVQEQRADLDVFVGACTPSANSAAAASPSKAASSLFRWARREQSADSREGSPAASRSTSHTKASPAALAAGRPGAGGSSSGCEAVGRRSSTSALRQGSGGSGGGGGAEHRSVEAVRRSSDRQRRGSIDTGALTFALQRRNSARLLRGITRISSDSDLSDRRMSRQSSADSVGATAFGLPAAGRAGGSGYCRQTTNDRIEQLLSVMQSARATASTADTGAGQSAEEAANGGANGTCEISPTNCAGAAYGAVGSSSMREHAAGGSGPVWHSVHVRPAAHPVTGTKLLMVTQMDVTKQMEARTQLVQLLQHEHKILESVFPRHVIEYLTLQPGAAGGGASPGGGGVGLEGNNSLLSLHQSSAMQLAQLATAHPCVTILFADIVSFTTMCKEVSPLQVMMFLNQLYSRLDSMLDIYKVYKVETIGDCYVVAGGLVARDEEGYKSVLNSGQQDRLHAVRVMAFAKAMLREARKVLMPHTREPVQLRIGMHSGPIVSGVVGSKMPRFCLFGDTVNTASRMESTSLPGKVHVSADTHALLASERWESTGGILVKGKGMMQTYIWSGDALEDKGEQLQRVLGVYL